MSVGSALSAAAVTAMHPLPPAHPLPTLRFAESVFCRESNIGARLGQNCVNSFIFLRVATGGLAEAWRTWWHRQTHKAPLPANKCATGSKGSGLLVMHGRGCAGGSLALAGRGSGPRTSRTSGRHQASWQADRKEAVRSRRPPSARTAQCPHHHHHHLAVVVVVDVDVVVMRFSEAALNDGGHRYKKNSFFFFFFADFSNCKRM